VNAYHSLIDELEDVIAGNDIGHRAKMLRRLTDLFVVTSGKLSDEQMDLFDDVMNRLVDEIDIAARAAFGDVLATIPDAPQNIVHRLAMDDAIGVAGPILTRSSCVSERTLVESATTKSQAHLFAISLRRTLSEPVTDILVGRGNREVVLSTAGNPGAAFSEFGYSTLVERSARNDELAVRIWLRPEIPRQHLLRLFAEASDSVKLELTRKDPSKATLIADTIAQASSQLQARTRGDSARYAAAYALVRSLHDAGGLNESRLADFAQNKQFDEVVVALSHIGDLPINLVERAFIHEQPEQVIVLTKANEISWETTKALLMLQNSTHGSARKCDRLFETFMRLKTETAKKAVGFYRLREKAAMQRSEGVG
jgi:uncharacterized protein (DUF2336 family)